MQDKRLVNRLTDYWDRLRGDEPFPAFERLNQDALVDMWEHCIVLAVESKTNKENKLYVYQHMGSQIIEAYGSDLTGHYVNVYMHNFPGWQVLKLVDKVFKESAIESSMGSFINDKDQVVKYRACVMPFGSKGLVTHALVGLSWKMFS